MDSAGELIHLDNQEFYWLVMMYTWDSGKAWERGYVYRAHWYMYTVSEFRYSFSCRHDEYLPHDEGSGNAKLKTLRFFTP